MKVLDRYLTRELFAPIAYATTILVFLILIVDLFDNLEDLLRYDTPLGVILHYYASLVPHSFIEIIPWACWLGTLFLLVNLGFHNETIAMKAAGLKITTIIKPILFLGFLIGIATFLVSDRVVPKTLRKANELSQVYIEKKKLKSEEKMLENVTYYSGKDELYFFRSLAKNKGEVTGVVILWLNNARISRHKTVAHRGVWKDPGWELYEVTEYQMDSQGRILGEPRTYPKKFYRDIKFSPTELAAASSDTSYLTYKELKDTISRLKENGVNVYSEKVDLHQRMASPWQGLVMMLITIPLLARTANRKLIAVKVLICVGLVFAFHVSGAISLALGKAGRIIPFLSAWMNNILFSIGALFALEKANH